LKFLTSLFKTANHQNRKDHIPQILNHQTVQEDQRNYKLRKKKPFTHQDSWIREMIIVREDE
jgi:hypothetical protein